MCVCVCEHARMCVCVVCVPARECICLCVYLCVCVCVCLGVFECVLVYVHICVCVCLNVKYRRCSLYADTVRTLLSVLLPHQSMELGERYQCQCLLSRRFLSALGMPLSFDASETARSYIQLCGLLSCYSVCARNLVLASEYIENP